MNLFAVSDDTILSIVNSLFQFLGAVFTGIMAYYMARLNSKATAASETVKKATATVSQKLDDITSATEVTNNLVESGGATRGT